MQAAFANEATLARYGSSRGAVPRRFYVGTCNEAAYGFTIFTSEFVVDAMANVQERRYFVDGTFRVVPDGEFVQLLVIHLDFKNHVS